MTTPQHARKPVIGLILWGLAAVGLLGGLMRPMAGLAPPGTLFDPLDGLYRTARTAEHPSSGIATLPALDGTVTLERDERGVPHIFAGTDRDAIMALGYVVAQDRLFQLDFLPKVAAGRLSEIFGAGSVETDRFLRRTGMEWGVQKNVARIVQEGGLEYDLLRWFIAGANAYIDALAVEDLPFEFRLFDYQPERLTPAHAVRLMQYFAYDLTYRSDAASYGTLQQRLGAEAFARLFPRRVPLAVPIIPEPGRGVSRRTPAATAEGAPRPGDGPPPVRGMTAVQQRALGTWAEGFVDGKGSNNWVVAGSRSATGAPLLAGDMHLSLTLPAIWYETHLVTPSMNTYGVTTPGTPLPIEAFNEDVAWAFTNTGADVIDHYALELDETRLRYRFEDGWRALDAVPDTIRVKGQAPLVDTLYYAHWGPVVFDGEEAVATRWVAHEPSRTLLALWGMNHARNLDDFEAALRQWDTPMQNIVYADVAGNIAIRSTGYLPIRRGGHGVGLLDGSTRAFEWIGRVPFEDLPHALNPAQGFLTSTNQQPADATYPYYLGHDWRSVYRSVRIDTLLRGRKDHTVADFKRYQADVHAVQRDLFVPMLDTLQGLSSWADSLRGLLTAWPGETTVDRAEPLILDEFLRALDVLAWDEPVFQGVRRPDEAVLFQMLRDEPDDRWLDVQATDERERAAGLMRLALEAAADTLRVRYGRDVEAWRWGDHHTVVFRHMTLTPALRALWRGPQPYPGFAETLSPAAGRLTTHSASWRVVVDFSRVPPVGYGVYPGGQSGHPFSAFYDLHVPAYVQFEHYPLSKPGAPGELTPAVVSSRLTLHP